MPALKPLPSLARATANRANAAKSTGPKTDAGKARSRENATVHGLAGAGVALPTEDAAAVAERFAALCDQFQPATPLGAHYVGRIALATVRLDRAARHETAALSLRVRHAADDFARVRRAEADAALARLRAGDGPAAQRDLLRTPEGITHLDDELRGLALCLDLPEPLWSREHGARLEACLGIAPDPLIPSRVQALTNAALGADDLLTRRDLAAIAEAQITESTYALRQIVALIDHERTALRADLAAIDPARIEADRAGAADLALFDPSPAAQLARRYEAAATRELDRALRRLHEVEAAASATDEMTELTEPAQSPIEPIEEPATIALKRPACHDLKPVLASFGSGVSDLELAASIPGVSDFPHLSPNVVSRIGQFKGSVGGLGSVLPAQSD